MSAQYASPADWAVARKVIVSNRDANVICAARGEKYAEAHAADAAALDRVLVAIAIMNAEQPPAPLPSRFASKHGDMARLVVGDQ